MGPIPFPRAVAECGEQLNRTYRRADGSFVHASDLFGTSQAVDDLADVLSALRLRAVDVYGDSYGSFFGQVFAARYPTRVRSLVLDSTYPTIHQDPFDAAGQDEIRFAFDAVCRRSVPCHDAAPGSSLARIHALGSALDRRPLVADTSDPTGGRRHLRITGADIATLLGIAGDDYGPYRNLDGAARAYLEHDDAAPLARLYAWSGPGGPSFTPYPYTEYSEGLAIADSCTVCASPFSLQAPLAVRRRQYAEAVADLAPAFGYPLTNADVFGSPNEGYDECLTWPAPVHREPIVTREPPLVPRTLPVLILSGDLDVTTSPGDARRAAAQLGPSVRFVSLPNAIHAPALGDPFTAPRASYANS